MAPTLTFTPMGSNTSTFVMAQTPSPYAYDLQAHLGATPWEPSSVTASAGVAQGTAAVAGPGTAGGTTLSASGHAGNSSSLYAFESASYSAAAEAPLVSGGFVLSANTFAILSSMATATAAGTATTVIEEYASASVAINLAGPGGGGSGSQTANDSLATGGYGTPNPFSFTRSGLLAVSFLNQTDADLAGTLNIQASAYGYAYATQVPEPATCGLRLLGMAALGWRARRR